MVRLIVQVVFCISLSVDICMGNMCAAGICVGGKPCLPYSKSESPWLWSAAVANRHVSSKSNAASWAARSGTAHGKRWQCSRRRGLLARKVAAAISRWRCRGIGNRIVLTSGTSELLSPPCGGEREKPDGIRGPPLNGDHTCANGGENARFLEELLNLTREPSGLITMPRLTRADAARLVRDLTNGDADTRASAVGSLIFLVRDEQTHSKNYPAADWRP